MVTPYYSIFALELFHKQGRENTQPVEMWQKGGFSPHKRTQKKDPGALLAFTSPSGALPELYQIIFFVFQVHRKNYPQAVNDFSSSPGVLREVYIRFSQNLFTT